MIFYWNFILFVGHVIVKAPFHFPKNWQYFCSKLTFLSNQTARPILSHPNYSHLPRGCSWVAQRHPSLFWEQPTLNANMHKVRTSATVTNQGWFEFFGFLWLWCFFKYCFAFFGIGVNSIPYWHTTVPYCWQQWQWYPVGNDSTLLTTVS